ncbi:hypothetical protein AB0E96_41075, partial [Kitasatospora sp. NPDC036755]|uniref:hypothetical protein n=1 Tax=Kitasatospora sp. NPDC036755 TaxID=3154600 RepID=UPI0033F25C13
MSYALRNDGETPVADVRITDTLAPGVEPRCPGGAENLPRLGPGTTVVCTATLRVQPGEHRGQATARAAMTYGRGTVTRTTDSGYTGVEAFAPTAAVVAATTAAAAGGAPVTLDGPVCGAPAPGAPSPG